MSGSFCNVDLLATYDAKYFGYLSKGDRYDGVFNKGFSDMIAPRSTDVECKNAFVKIVQDTHAQFGDMLAVAYALLETVRSELQLDGGTASPQNFPIHMPVRLNGNDVKLGLPGWNLTSSVTTTDGTTVEFGHNRPLTVEENPEQFKVLLPKCGGDKRIAELYAVGGSFLLLACGFTQEKTVRGGKNPFYLGPEILEKFGIKQKTAVLMDKFEEELNSALEGELNSEEEGVQTTMEPEGTGASESTSETQHYVSTEDVDKWWSLSPEERANVPDPRGIPPSSKHTYSYAKQAWVLRESPMATLMRVMPVSNYLVQTEKRPLSSAVTTILKQYEAMNFDPSFLRNTTFKYIAHYKETGEQQDRLTIALYDFGYTKKELDGLSLSQVVSELLARKR